MTGFFGLSSSTGRPARKTKGGPSRREKEPEEEEEVVEPPKEVANKKKQEKPASSGSGLAETLKRGVALAKLRKTMDVASQVNSSLRAPCFWKTARVISQSRI